MDSNSLEQLAKLELRHKKFTLVGTGNVQAAGSLKTGFAVNIGRFGGVGNGGGGGGGEPTTGACCYNDGTCATTSPASCALGRGHYQGDGTNCDDVDCTGGGTGTSGACCVEEVCDIETPRACSDDGGVYQGDGSVCDPNPCSTPLPPCSGCGFNAFDGSGRKFHTKTTVANLTEDGEHQNFCGLFDQSYTIVTNTTKVETYSESCAYSCDCSGSAVATASTGTCTATASGCGGDSNFRGFGGCSFDADSCSAECTPLTSAGHPIGSCSSEGHSATVRTTTYSCTDGDGVGPTRTYSGTVTETLSDECMPDGFSPPP